MKKFSLSVLILSLVVMIAACGAAETPALEPVEAPAPTATEAPEPTTAPEPEATEAPAAEAEAPAEAEAAADADTGEADVQVVEVTMHVAGYTPAAVTVKAGTLVRFELTNSDSEEHDLYNRKAGIDVAVGASSAEIYEWMAPEKPGEYVAECSFHEGLSMTVVVEE